MVDFADIVAVIQMLQKKIHILNIILIGQGHVVIRNLIHFGRFDGVTESNQGIANGVEIVLFGKDLKGFLVRGKISSAGFESRFHQCILVNVILAENNDYTLILKHKGYAAALSQISAVFIEEMAHIGSGAVTAVSSGFNDYGNAGRTVSLVHDLFVHNGVGATGLFNGTVDIIVGNIVGFCLCDQIAQLAVVIRIGTALTNRDSNLLANFCKDLTLLASVFAFLFLILFHLLCPDMMNLV